MGQSNSMDLIIQIDDQVAGLLEEINAAPGGSESANFAENLKNVVLESICGPFGLSLAMFDDRDGGSVTTLHNFEKGIVANDADAQRQKDWTKSNAQEFDRNGYDKQLKEERKPLFQSGDKIVSGYTGKELPKNGQAHRDHVVSAAAIERSSKGHLGQNREERIKTANAQENLVWAESSLNMSKGDQDALQWAEKTKVRNGVEMANADYFDVDRDLLEKTYTTARHSVDSAQNMAVLKKQVKEFCSEGGKEGAKVAMRQVLGMILKELATGLIEDVRRIVREGFKNVENLVSILRSRMHALVKTIRDKWSEFLAEGAAASFSGLLSNLITLVINSFLTTAKRFVTILREATLAVVRSFKLIISPPSGMTGVEIASEALKLLVGGLVTAATILLQESVAKSLESFPLFAPFANEIATALVAILSGTMGLLTILAFDRLKSNIAFQNKQLADAHRGQAVSLLKIQRTMFVLDNAYGYVQQTSSHMKLQLDESWAAVEETSISADQAISEYSVAVDEFRKLVGAIQ